MLNYLRAVAVLFLLLPSALVAQDFNFGLRAFNAGDYAVALQEWSPSQSRATPLHRTTSG